MNLLKLSPVYIIGKNINQIFSLYQKILTAVGTSRVDITNRIVSPITPYQKAYSIIMLLTVSSAYLYVFIGYMSKLYKLSRRLFICIEAIIALHFASYIMNFIHLRFLNNNSNVQFILSLEELDRCMKIDQNKSINIQIYRLNKVVVTMLLVAGVIFVGSSYLDGSLLAVVTVTGAAASEITDIVDVCTSASLIFYFTLRLRFINAIVINHLNQQNDLQESLPYPESFMRQLASVSHNFCSTDTDVYLREFIKRYNEFENLYRFQILVLCCKTICGLALYFAGVLISIPMNVVEFIQVHLLVSFTTAHGSIVLFICILCEIFLREVKKSKEVCTKVMSVHTDGPLRHKARKMLRMLRANPLRFSVYDMWHMDAGFVVRLLGICTILMFTMLQLAFL